MCFVRFKDSNFFIKTDVEKYWVLCTFMIQEDCLQGLWIICGTYSVSLSSVNVTIIE